jgi:hypothetical protein
MMAERNPWGNDAYSALRWAFNRLATSEVLPTALGSVHHTGRRIGLSRADLHAQASIIRDVAVGIDNPLHKAYLTAYFLGPPSLERLPGGGVGWVDRSHDERAAAVHQVAWWLLGTAGTGVHRIRGYQEIVMQYTLGRPNNKRLRDVMRVRNASIVAVREKAYSRLDELHAHALAAAARRLEDAGLI